MIGVEQFMHFFQMLFRQLSPHPKFHIQARIISCFIAIVIFLLALVENIVKKNRSRFPIAVFSFDHPRL